MKTLLIIPLICANLYALSEEAMHGEGLYTDNNCQECHTVGSEFDPKNYTVKSLSNLDGWVSSCATNFNISWFPDEQDAVVKYLNETFYKLDK